MSECTDPDGLPAPVVYTIGHSNHPLDGFLALLRGTGITAVADVRSVPVSRWAPHFNRVAIEAALRAVGIDYLFLGRELGGRPRDPALYRDGRLDYELVAALEPFRRGLDHVLDAAAGRRLALMCAERDPLDCHRRLLVAPHLAARGATVRHILADGRIERDEDADARAAGRMPRQQDLFGMHEVAVRRSGSGRRRA